MGVKHPLKKLKKEVVKVQSKSLQQLKELSAHRVNTDQHANHHISHWQSEFKQVSQQTLVNVASELVVPLNPVLSWFNEGISTEFVGSRNKGVGIKKDVNVRPNVKSIVHLPLKSPPCKRCPALSNGVCKCAAKKLKISA